MNNNLINEIHTYVLAHKPQIVNTLKELIKIPSVSGESLKDAPFGTECARVLEFTQSLYKNNGFETEYDKNGGYLLSYYGEGEKTLGIFAHADVVPVSDDWLLTKPFEPIEKDGCLIGRGALDDKSAIVISLFCAKIIKELNIPFKSRLVLFTGGNEENGMGDIKNYLKIHTPPEFSLVADTGFPAYIGDKGILHFVATCNTPFDDITDFSGGKAFNIVLGEASAKFKGETLTAKGISSHGALPEGSLNAAYLLAKELSRKANISNNDKKQMLFIKNTLEKYYGEVFGIENTDADFGRLTCTNGMVYTTDGKVNLTFDMRCGMSVDSEEAKAKITGYFKENGWSVEFVKSIKPFLISKDNKYLKACLNTYKEFTGNATAETYVNAGGTYAGQLPQAIEIGATLYNDRSFHLPSGHGGAHQPDEYINIEGLLKAIELTALMLLECDKIGE